jgi:hypothetical protein
MELQDNSVLSSNEDGLGARMLHTCSELFDHAIVHLKDTFTNSQMKRLVRLRQLLLVWADSHDVEDGVLDTTLQNSKYLMATVISVLRALLKTLFEGTLRYPS